MLFNSAQYAIFFPLVLIVYWQAPARRRVDILLVASYVFYATWSIPYAAMMFLLAVSNYWFGAFLHKHRNYAALITFVSIDLAVLVVFKYLDFFTSSTYRGLYLITGWNFHTTAVSLVLPLGISFFTFEFIHYLVDIFLGQVPVHGFSKFHVFAAFFPTQISGPIKRFEQFVPDLDTVGTFRPQLAQGGFQLLARGLAKKVVLADTLAPIAAAGFDPASATSLTTGEAWIATLAFSLQIYFDFSGYTDMARGSAQLLGFKIPANFDAPYIATSVSDFWRRWHISLSSWLRDYLYIALGGSRQGFPRTALALMLTMTLGGLWHGAAWHFVAWGAFWGVILVVDRIRRLALRVPSTAGLSLAGWGVTQLVVLVGWVFFRAQSVEQATSILTAMVGTRMGPPRSWGDAMYVGLVAAGLVATWKCWPIARTLRLPAAARPALAGAVAATLIAAIAALAPPDGPRFIYFQF